MTRAQHRAAKQAELKRQHRDAAARERAGWGFAFDLAAAGFFLLDAVLGVMKLLGGTWVFEISILWFIGIVLLAMGRVGALRPGLTGWIAMGLGLLAVPL